MRSLTLRRGAAMSATALASLSLVASSGASAAGTPTDITTGDAGSVTMSSAHLNGSVNPAGATVEAHFEYGQTDAYGSRTADQQVAVATTPQAFGADVDALPEHAVIHYRAVVDGDAGTFYGPDRTFVTGVRLPGPIG